jgi:division protein CdvB (Snf7/Vps24/ESCRT-III family)
MENSIQTENITKLELENNLNYIIDELNKLKEINNKLESYKSQIKTIEKQINNKLDIYTEVKEEFYKILENIKNEPKLDEKFLKNSMLIYIPETISEEPNTNINKNKVAEVLINNWTEKCFVKDEYDLYEVNFEYEAVGLQKGYFPIEDIPLAKDRI